MKKKIIITGFIYMILLITLCCKTYSQSFQFQQIKQQICSYENLFKEIQFHSSYIYCISDDSSLFFFNLYPIQSLTVFSKSDKFLFDVMMKLDYYFNECSIKESNDLLIYTFKQTNYETKNQTSNN